MARPRRLRNVAHTARKALNEVLLHNMVDTTTRLIDTEETLGKDRKRLVCNLSRRRPRGQSEKEKERKRKA